MSMKQVVRVVLAGLALLGLAGSGPGRAEAQAPAPSAAPSPAVPPATAPGKDPLLEFVPSDHVPADSAVSFPVDI
jgi:hypothetical protein